MKFSCGITLYNPNDNNITNIYDYCKSFERVYLYDNSDKINHLSSLNNLIEKNLNIQYYSNNCNEGLPVVYNKMCKQAIKDGFSYICLIYQDSIFPPQDIEKLKKAICECDAIERKTAVYAPRIEYLPPQKKLTKRTVISEKPLSFVKWVISSGSFINLDIYKTLKGFDENYFIDRVDYDFCLSFKNKYRVCRVNDSLLYQSLGTAKSFLGYNISQHSPLRVYYAQRNRLYYYFRKNSSFINCIKAMLLTFKQILRIILFEDEKTDKLLKSIQGIYDFLRGRFGRYKSKNRKRKFVVVKMMGGLGNQLFQIAFAKALALKYDLEIIIDKSVYNHYKIRNYSLDNICISNELYDIEKIDFPIKLKFIYILSSTIYNYFRKLLSYFPKYRVLIKYIYRKLSFHGLFYYFINDYCPYSYKGGNNIFLYGYFQSDKFFKQYANHISENLRVKSEPTEKEKYFLDKIANECAVALSIRVDDDYKQYIVCDNEYYNKGMDIIFEKVANVKFYVFSDCPARVKQNFSFKYPVTYIEDFKDFQSLRLLYSCKHFIISNSSFSWWGAYLANYRNKIIVTPSVWMPRGFSNDIFQEGMIKINV